MKEVIIKIVEELYGIDGNRLFEKNKNRNIAHIKQSIFFYMRNELGFTYKKIGEVFNLGSSNIVLGVKAFKDKISVYSSDKIAYEQLKESFDEYGLTQ